jgi:hypothetical protein
MESSQIITGAVALVVGAAIGYGVTKISSTGNTGTPAKPPTIELSEATSLVENYVGLGRPLNQNLFAFALDTAQIHLMTDVMANDPTIPGFRLYLASSSRSSFEKTGADNRSAVYKSTGPHVGPCPNLCDRNALGQ